jgi:hypothetical protein
MSATSNQDLLHRLQGDIAKSHLGLLHLPWTIAAAGVATAPEDDDLGVAPCWGCVSW